MAFPDSSALPPELARRAELAWERILERASDEESAGLTAALADSALAVETARVLAAVGLWRSSHVDVRHCC